MGISNFLQHFALVSPIVASYLFLVVLLHSKRHPQNRFLALGIFILTTAMWARYIFAIQSTLVFFVPFFTFPIYWWHGPAMYAYFRSSIDPAYRPRTATLVLHALPAIASYGLHIYLFNTRADFHSLEIILNQLPFPGTYTALYLIILAPYNAIYLALSVLLIRDWRRQLKEPNQRPEKRAGLMIPWYYTLLAVMLGYYLMNFAHGLLTLLGIVRMPLNLPDAFFEIAVFYALLFFIIRRPGVLHPPEQASGRYAKQSLDSETAGRYRTELLEYMQRHRPYLEEGLHLKRLAELTGIPAHHLSIVINRELKMNFYNFINAYRVDEAKRLIQSEDHREDSLLAICFAAGFQSKAAFNSAFKRIEGVAPGEFRKSPRG